MTEGLELFDDKASAAGGFPIVFRGYERDAVDDYIHDLESAVSLLRAELREAATLQPASFVTTTPEEIPLGAISVRAAEILTSAEERARDVLHRASLEASRIREEAAARAVEAETRNDRETSVLHDDQRAQLEQWRRRSLAEATKELQEARASAHSVIVTARSHSEEIVRQAEQHARALREEGQLQAREVVSSAEADAAATRQRLGAEQAQTLARLRQDYDTARTQLARITAEAERIARSSTDKVTDTGKECAAMRHRAHADADTIRANAQREIERESLGVQQRISAKAERLERTMNARKVELEATIAGLENRHATLEAQVEAMSSAARDMHAATEESTQASWAAPASPNPWVNAATPPDNAPTGSGQTGHSSPDHG